MNINETLRLHRLWLSGDETGVRANLRGADLRGADLSEAKLNWAKLSEAKLNWAKLSEANLRGANLRGANLREANLREANLRGANLREANLREANLREANLRGADLSEADLRGADLGEAKLNWAKLGAAPIVADIHNAVYGAATAPGALDMGRWHTCATTHCRAGWVITLAGDAGKSLEDKIGPSAAAALIYMASDPTLERIPNWLATDDDALADMARLAGARKL